MLCEAFQVKKTLACSFEVRIVLMSGWLSKCKRAASLTFVNLPLLLLWMVNLVMIEKSGLFHLLSFKVFVVH